MMWLEKEIVGPPALRLVLDPLAVIFPNNRLYIAESQIYHSGVINNVFEDCHWINGDGIIMY